MLFLWRFLGVRRLLAFFLLRLAWRIRSERSARR
jgi:hypothetical protein